MLAQYHWRPWLPHQRSWNGLRGYLRRLLGSLLRLLGKGYADVIGDTANGDGADLAASVASRLIVT